MDNLDRAKEIAIINKRLMTCLNISLVKLADRREKEVDSIQSLILYPDGVDEVNHRIELVSDSLDEIVEHVMQYADLMVESAELLVAEIGRLREKYLDSPT